MAPFLFLNMIRQNIILGNFTYIVDLYKANSDLNATQHYEEFVMLKTTNFVNNVMSDKDVFFIKKSIFDKCTNDGVIDTNALGQMIAFPITNNAITMSYTSEYTLFNENYMPQTFKLDGSGDIFRTYKNDCETFDKILCDKIRVWLPITNSKLTSLIHVSNIVNDVRFHYICENLGNYESDANGELKIYNNIYSEYIDIWIPNVEDLFTPSKHYVKEVFNLTQFKQKITYVESEEEHMYIYPCIYFDKFSENGGVQKKFKIEAFRTYGLSAGYNVVFKINDEEIPLHWDIMSLNYTYENPINDDDKLFVTIKCGEDIINEYNVYQSEIKYKNDTIYCSTFLMILPFFIEEQEMLNESFGCKTYFNVETNLLENILANPIVVSLYPFSEINETTKNYVASTTPENSDIFTLSKDLKMAINFEFNKEDPNRYGEYMLNCKFIFSKLFKQNLQDFYLNKVKLNIYDYLNVELDNEEFDEQIFNPKLKKCGFVIEIASDTYFKEILYEYVVNMDIVDVDSTIIEDSKFKLNFNFKDIMWNAYPDSLVIRVKYEDKVSYTTIGSNSLFITKENFKYIINDEASRLMLVDSNQNGEQLSKKGYDNIYEKLKEKNENEEMNLSYFNFIDKINCTIVKSESENENKITNNKNNQKIVFKPVFYKVKDLQQIKLKNGITQNIGLNLSDIISKADTFKVVIENIEFPEVARNDAYVIFKVNSQQLKNASGQYNLLNQDDEYISDGTWYIY